MVRLEDYKAPGVAYDVFTPPGGTATCREQPLRERFPQPPVNTFVYNGTGTFNDGTKFYRWTEPQFRDQEYFTSALCGPLLSPPS